jgi:SAM-dependent methyltransferase
MSAGYGDIRDRVAAASALHYRPLMLEHGGGPLAVGWNSPQAQQARFESLARVLHSAREPFEVLDYGCGTGDLLEWLRDRGFACSYTGFDVSETMLQVARVAHRSAERARFTSATNDLARSDFVIASGMLNLRFDIPDDEWHAYAVEVVDELGRLARHGFAFNMLTSHSDRDRMRPDLHYADPAWWLDHCLRRFSTRVALLHDYEVWDFTVVVRMDARPAARQ